MGLVEGKGWRKEGRKKKITLFLVGVCSFVAMIQATFLFF